MCRCLKAQTTYLAISTSALNSKQPLAPADRCTKVYSLTLEFDFKHHNFKTKESNIKPEMRSAWRVVFNEYSSISESIDLCSCTPEENPKGAMQVENQLIDQTFGSQALRSIDKRTLISGRSSEEL